MLKREIKYKTFDGEDAVDTHYFNLTKSELVELEAGETDGLEAMIKNIIAANDKKEIIAQFKRIILLAYGEKSPDGKRFVKSDELRTAFSQTAAYDALFIELATDTDSAVEFITKVIPSDLAKEVATELPQPTPPPPPVLNPVEGPQS